MNAMVNILVILEIFLWHIVIDNRMDVIWGG